MANGYTSFRASHTTLVVSVLLMMTALWQSSTTSRAQSGNGPIVIAVLSDHYTSGEEALFNLDVENLFKNGIFADPFYAGHEDAFTIVPIFKPWAATPATPESNYEFKIDATTTNCSVSWSGQTAGLIEDAVKAQSPWRTVVVSNYGFVFGCTQNPWTYVPSGAVGRGILEHELGHSLAGLFDEYANAAHLTHQYPGTLDCRNCSTATPPHWANRGLTGVTNENGCELYGLGIAHPFDACRMAGDRVGFCELCRREMTSAMAYKRNPDTWNPETGVCVLPNAEPVNPDVSNPSLPAAPRNMRISGAGLLVQPSATTRPIVRVLLSLDATSGTSNIVRVTDVTGRFVPEQRRLSDWVYEITDNNTPLNVGVVEGDPFQVRDYRGSVPRHEQSAARTAQIVLQIPDVTTKQLAEPTRAIRIVLYRLRGQISESRITAQTLGQLREKKQAEAVFTITPEVFRKSL
jgi:hypothetical protein